MPHPGRSVSSPKLKGGGAICRLSARDIVKSRRTEIFRPLFRKNSLVFQLNTTLIYMLPTFRTKHEKRVHFGHDKGHSSGRKWGAKLSFQNEGEEAVAPNAPPKSATASKHGTPTLTSLPKDCEVRCEVRPPRSTIRSLT